MIRWAVVWWLAWSAAGAALIALPDSGPRLVTLSSAHGPGLVDALGIVLLLVGSVGLWWFLWRHRSALTLRPQWTFAAGLGVGLLIASVAGDFAWWWAVGATILLALQILALAAVASAR